MEEGATYSTWAETEAAKRVRAIAMTFMMCCDSGVGDLIGCSERLLWFGWKRQKKSSGVLVEGGSERREAFLSTFPSAGGNKLPESASIPA